MDEFLPPHGGDLRRLLKEAGLSEDQAGELLDLSVNVRASGPPEYLRLAMTRALADVGRYPSPHGEEAKEAAARHHGVSPDQIVIANGTNELFYAIAGWLAEWDARKAIIVDPAFSTYDHACGRCLMDVSRSLGSLEAKRDASGRTFLERDVADVFIEELEPNGSVFLANPGNPSGNFLEPKEILKLIRMRPDLTWVIDEAFILYAGTDAQCSIIPHLKKLAKKINVVVVRSLTKFHGLAGIRAGYAVLSRPVARQLELWLCEWRANALALAACRAIFSGTEEVVEDEEKTRARNIALREHLVQCLQDLPLDIYLSRANYLLVRLHEPMLHLACDLLQKEKIAIRDCRNFHGCEDGCHFRIAVRDEAANERIAEALGRCLLPGTAAKRARTSGKQKKTPALMLQGTGSGAGKSVLAAAFCRIFKEDGFNVAPFKAQNMALNSGVTLDGLEMGRAQITQAMACGLEPDVRMNPVLLKPMSDRGSQIVLLGKPHKILPAKDFLTEREALRKPIEEAYASLAAEHDLMVLEGAGSPAEVNLKAHDLVNMNMAKFADARVLLCGDIDRGGVYASFLGTWLTFDEAERRLLSGFLVNRFRGDESLLAPAHEYLKKATGKDVLGVIPWLSDLELPEEDSLTLASSLKKAPEVKDYLDIAVIALGATSNFTDLAPFKAEKDVRLRVVENLDEFGDPHIVVLPGSRSVAADLAELDKRGLDGRIRCHVDEGGWLVGLCGGLQMAGIFIEDPYGVESQTRARPGLGILEFATGMGAEKTLVRRENVPSPFGVPCSGYEIHHGVTHLQRDTLDRFDIMWAEDKSFLGILCDRVFVTYLHGIFDEDKFRRAFLNHVRKSLKMRIIKKPGVYSVDAGISRLAREVRACVDMDRIYRELGIR